MRTWTAVLATALVVTLGACGDDDTDPVTDDATSVAPSPSTSPSPSVSLVESATPTPVEEPLPSPSEPAGTVVAISIEGDTITPGGERLEVGRDEVVTLEINSDRAGELHVHSKPEQYVEFEAGRSTHELVISAPGVVDVEEHESGQVLVQLEVS